MKIIPIKMSILRSTCSNGMNETQQERKREEENKSHAYASNCLHKDLNDRMWDGKTAQRREMLTQICFSN